MEKKVQSEKPSTFCPITQMPCMSTKCSWWGVKRCKVDEALDSIISLNRIVNWFDENWDLSKVVAAT